MQMTKIKNIMISDQESKLSMTTQECKADQIFPSMSKCEIDKDWEQELSTLFPDADRDEIGMQFLDPSLSKKLQTSL